MLTKTEYKQILHNCRETILKASFTAGACHIGSALSCVGILIDVYYNLMKPKDVFIFSKASGVSALYAVLAEFGTFSKDKVAYYLKNYPLADKKVPGVFCCTGSLGHGNCIATGVAWAYKNKGIDVYCLMGDGEVTEGSLWESVLFARHHKLTNLKIIVDRNSLVACGSVEGVIDTFKPLHALAKLFPIDIRYSIKGLGISFMENSNVWHYKNLDEDTLREALCQI
jgi:transketolase